MKKIGNYEYPNYGAFEDSVAITRKAIENFGGIIPLPDAARVLGYKIHEKTKLSGTVYQRIKDLECFGLFRRDRSGLRITDLARSALHPYDEETAKDGKIKAIRNITIIGKAFDQWNGNIPDISAFPGKLADISDINWTDCKKHVPTLNKLFVETFPYLRSQNESTPGGTIDEISTSKSFTEVRVGEQKPHVLKGELKSTIGSVFITDISTLNLARKLLDVFEEQLNKAESKLEDDNNSVKGSKGE